MSDTPHAETIDALGFDPRAAPDPKAVQDDWNGMVAHATRAFREDVRFGHTEGLQAGVPVDSMVGSAEGTSFYRGFGGSPIDAIAKDALAAIGQIGATERPARRSVLRRRD